MTEVEAILSNWTSLKLNALITMNWVTLQVSAGSQGNLGKGKALMSTQKDWADTSSSEDEIDYENIALMAISSEKNGSPKSSSQISIYSIDSVTCLDSEGIRTIQAEVKNLLANFRSLTNETDRLNNTNAELTKKNNFLESELVDVEQLKAEF